MKKYLHCGECWKILGEIPNSEPETEFDTYDCSWNCDCERLNLSSDGIVKKFDSLGDVHYIYVREDTRVNFLTKKIQNGFDFDRGNFKPANLSKLL